MNDPISDFLTRIRNATVAGHDTVVAPGSKQKAEIARLLKDEGYITEFSVERERVGTSITVSLKIDDERRPVIRGIKRASKPGCRIYVKQDKIPKVIGGMGTAIISTSQGIVSGHEARRRGIGGEVVAYIW